MVIYFPEQFPPMVSHVASEAFQKQHPVGPRPVALDK